MKGDPMKLFASIPFLCIVVLFSGCVGEEHTYVENRELKPGPGLFSGKDGVFTVYGDSSHSIEKTGTGPDNEKGKKEK